MNMIEEYDVDLALVGWLISKKSRSQGFTSHTAFRIFGAKIGMFVFLFNGLQGHKQASWINPRTTRPFLITRTTRGGLLRPPLAFRNGRS